MSFEQVNVFELLGGGWYQQFFSVNQLISHYTLQTCTVFFTICRSFDVERMALPFAPHDATSTGRPCGLGDNWRNTRSIIRGHPHYYNSTHPRVFLSSSTQVCIFLDLPMSPMYWAHSFFIYIHTVRGWSGLNCLRTGYCSQGTHSQREHCWYCYLLVTVTMTSRLQLTWFTQSTLFLKVIPFQLRLLIMCRLLYVTVATMEQ